jgi:hypothetical protein
VWLRAVALVAVRPWLWVSALVQLLRIAPARWWREPPYLPVPDAEYLRFRLATQYGGDAATTVGEPDPHDVVEYLEWCRAMGRRGRR